ncbi:hypothetical protein RI367_005435 [Sorochytrium milnesiophthora]
MPWDVTTCLVHSAALTAPPVVLAVVGFVRLLYAVRRQSTFKATRALWAKLALYVITSLISAATLIWGIIAVGSDDISLQVSSALLLAANIAAAVLAYTEHVKFNAGSMLLTVYWLLTACAQSLALRSYLHSADMPVSSALPVLTILSITFSALLFLVEGLWSTAVEPGMLTETHASPFSRLTFGWLTPLMVQGSKRPLTLDDVPICGPKMESEQLFIEYTKRQSKPRRWSRSLFWGLMQRQYIRVLLSISAQVFTLAMTFCSPPLLNRLLTFMQSYQPESTEHENAAVGYSIAVAMFVTSALGGITTQQTAQLSVQIALREVSTIQNAVYRKAMLLSASGLSSSSSGQIATHLSVDCQTLSLFLETFNQMWAAPVMVIVAMGFLYQILGVASICGVGIALLFLPLVGRAAKFLMRQSRIKMAFMDKRMQIISESVGAMKIIKLYGTGAYFLDKIMRLRHQELAAAFVNGMPTIMALVSFGVYTALAPPDQPLNVGKVFTAFSWFSIIASPLSVLFNVLTNASQALTSYRRIVDFLNLPEIDPQAATIDRTSNSSADAITVQQGTFTWHSDAVSADRFALSDVDLVFPRRSLTAVIGRVGSGKSSLLYAILGEMHKRAGQVNVNGKVAYVAQQAWIINGTVRDNILFGSVYDEKRYRQTLEACSLMSDLAILEQGDMTPIGDKGVNLSGGQRARVSLARAVYAGADIYLLDDCLSAVDAHVDKHIFTQVISNQGLLAKKTVVLVTHGVHHLKHCDRVVMLNDGRISQQGSYDDLLAQEGGFQTLIADYAAQEEQDESAKSESDLGSDVVTARAGNTVNVAADAGQLVALAAQPDKPVKGPADNSTTGTVGWPVYKAYISSMGKRNCLIYVVVFAGALGAHVSDQLWLKVLSAPPAGKTLAFYIGIYGIITACVILMEGLHSYWSKVEMSLRASRGLHHRLLTRVFRAPMYWLDSIPIGRVLNRFSSDIDIVDLTISKRWGNVATVCVGIAASSILIVQSSPWLLAILVAMFLILNFLKNFYLRTSRELFRISSACKAPMYQLSEEAVAGLVTIRAFAAQQLYATQIEAKIDPFVASFYIYDSVVKWLSLRVNIMGSFVMFAAALAAVVGRNTTSGQSAALAIINSNSLVMSLIILIENLCMVESSIVAVERIRGYFGIPQEAAQHDAKVEPQWPQAGQITFRNYTTAYKAANKPVLKDLNLVIRGGEKIGICGRTGAGKSTITLSLFRILEATQGSVEIDGQDISKVGLADLRSRLTIIPQDPALFEGTLRDNLDPLGEHDDAAVWKALDLVNLRDYVTAQEGKLQAEVKTGGSNFSAGQKQLLTLATALLRKQRIVIFDEATSATDAETDAFVQRTIRSEFKECTVLTIAHRLATIMDSDRILVLDKGCVSEFDSPANLLQNPESAFASMVASSQGH